jgi:alpha-beta hydrolase superfamily lysophospholipase
MTKEFLLPEDKKRLEELYVAYHSPWNEAHLQEIFKKEIDWIWSHYRKIK